MEFLLKTGGVSSKTDGFILIYSKTDWLMNAPVNLCINRYSKYDKRGTQGGASGDGTYSFSLKMTNFAVTMMNSAFKMMNFGRWWGWGGNTWPCQALNGSLLYWIMAAFPIEESAADPNWLMWPLLCCWSSSFAEVYYVGLLCGSFVWVYCVCL